MVTRAIADLVQREPTAVPVRLERLRLQGGGIEIADLAHPRLQELRLHTGVLPRDTARAVAEARLPSLHTLEVWLGTPEYDGDTEPGDLAALWATEQLPALRHLGVKNAQIPPDVVAAIAAAPIVAQLRTLDLSMGILQDDDVAPLLRHQERHVHLERLDVSRSYLTDAAVEARRARRRTTASTPSTSPPSGSDRGPHRGASGVRRTVP